jgi:hypothetical protein
VEVEVVEVVSFLVVEALPLEEAASVYMLRRDQLQSPHQFALIDHLMEWHEGQLRDPICRPIL